MLLSAPARTCAAIVAALAVLSLCLKFGITQMETGDRIAGVLWAQARYFTILTNGLVAILFMAMVMAGRQVSDRLIAGLVLWIASVGLIYRLLLAELWEPQGLQRIADQGVHAVVPMSVFLWWVIFARKNDIGWLDPLRWLLWPLAYLAYALVRGALDGVYPYPFLDPGRLAPPQLVWNCARLMEGFVGAGYLLFGATRLSPRPA
ncbi:Pr6Pr family membrane protein [Psychromarinibacter sp. S121]|uniref:Pr6Pr family membrane protein n=1 Tax=Psychromarinibacter sp. S121 TaxID=3415127 RepID=UPI003C7A7F80